MDWNSYNTRLNVYGTTPRERNVNRTKDIITRHAQSNPSCKSVKLNGVSTLLTINSSKKTYYKEFETLPGEKVVAGDYIEWADSMWLVYEADTDDEIYIDGKMYQCNYLLKWQDSSGNIIERWCITEGNESKGVEEDKVMQLGNGQLKVILPYDSETIKIRKDKRFFIDNNTTNPIPYKVTNASTTSNVRDGHGYLTFVVSENRTNTGTDRPDLMLCDYITPTAPPTPPDETIVLSTILGNTTLKIGYSKTYTVTFTDKDGNTLSDVNFTWNIVSTFNNDITSTISGQGITLKITNEDYIGETITLQVLVDDVINSKIDITVNGSF